MKKIAALLIVLSSLTTSLYANELTAKEREEGIKVIEKIREKMRKEEEEARIAKEKQIKEEKRLALEKERLEKERIKNLPPFERLKLKKKEANLKVDFAERVTRSVEREEKEIAKFDVEKKISKMNDAKEMDEETKRIKAEVAKIGKNIEDYENVKNSLNKLEDKIQALEKKVKR